MTPTARVTVALIAGLAIGLIADWTESRGLNAAVRTLEPLGTLWVNGIRMTVIPLVVALVIRAIAGSTRSARVGRLGARTAFLGISALVASTTACAFITPLLFRGLRLDAEGVAALRATAAGAVPAAAPPTFTDWLTSFVPVNPVRAAVDGAMLPLLVFVVAFAIALRRIEPGGRSTVVGLCDGVAEASLQLVRWVLALAPIGVFALTAGIGARLGLSAAGAIGVYVLVIVASFLAATIALYPAVAVGARVPVLRFAAAAAPAQAVALSARSSLAALPALIDGTGRLGVPANIGGFVLPLAVAMFKYTLPISWLVGSAFVARLYGLDFDTPRIAIVGLMGVLLSLAAPGIPSAGLFMIAPVYMTIGFPLEGIGVLIAVDAVPDMFKTTGNVTADLALATVVGHSKVSADADSPDTESATIAAFTL